MMQLVSIASHIRKVLGSTPNWGFFACCLHSLHEVLSGCSGFLTMIRNMHVRLISHSWECDGLETCPGYTPTFCSPLETLQPLNGSSRLKKTC